MATTLRSSTLVILPESRGVMTRIYFAVEHGGVLVGDFDFVEGVDIALDVRALKQRIKVVRSAELAGVEPWHMTVFGMWAEQQRVADVARLLGEEPCHSAAILNDLIGGMESAYFIVRITTPSFAAAAGASALGWYCARDVFSLMLALPLLRVRDKNFPFIPLLIR